MAKEMSMTKERYLARFGRAARWYLGAKDAADAVADYVEMADDGQECTLRARFGGPEYAARLLADRRAYGAWLAAFLLLVLCAAAALAESLWNFGPGPWTLGEELRAGVYFGAGLLVSLFCFAGHGRADGRAPAKLMASLAALALVGVCLGVYIAAVCTNAVNGAALPQTEAQVRRMFALIRGAGVLLLVAACAALWLARCSDRRWRAAYVLALTLLAMLAVLMAFFHRLSDPDALWPAVRNALLPFAVAGLVGTGVSLC